MSCLRCVQFIPFCLCTLSNLLGVFLELLLQFFYSFSRFLLPATVVVQRLKPHQFQRLFDQTAHNLCPVLVKAKKKFTYISVVLEYGGERAGSGDECGSKKRRRPAGLTARTV